jgi:hypothetical protein
VGATTGIGSLPHEDVDDALCLPGVPMWSVPTVGSSRARDPALGGTLAGHFGSYARSVSTLLSS